jgi:hypothetical protein
MRQQKWLRIAVKDQAEAEAIERALTDPSTRAFLVVVGVLLPFGDRARTRILSFINDKADEEAGRVSIETKSSRHHAEMSARLP